MLSLKSKVAAASVSVVGALSVPLLGATPALAATGSGSATFSNCSNNGHGTASCTIDDPAGIRRIRIVDANTGEVLKTIGLHCDNKDKHRVATVNNVPTGDSVRFVVYDCGTGKTRSRTVSH
jgi:hypothetical protein